MYDGSVFTPWSRFSVQNKRLFNSIHVSIVVVCVPDLTSGEARLAMANW